MKLINDLINELNMAVAAYPLQRFNRWEGEQPYHQAFTTILENAELPDWKEIADTYRLIDGCLAHRSGTMKVRLYNGERFRLKLNIWYPEFVKRIWDDGFGDDGFHTHQKPFVSKVLQGSLIHIFGMESLYDGELYDVMDESEAKKWQRYSRFVEIREQRIEKGEVYMLDPTLPHRVDPDPLQTEPSVTLCLTDQFYYIDRSVYRPLDEPRRKNRVLHAEEFSFIDYGNGSLVTPDFIRYH